MPAKEWYGAPIVITDLAALGLFFGGMAAADHSSSRVGRGVMIAGVGTYLVGGPIVHITQHKRGKVIASLGLRAGAPLAGALVGGIVGGAVGSQRSCGDNETCGLGGFAVGGVLGLIAGGLAAMAIDDAVFAYRAPTPRGFALTVTPVYQPATGQTALALRGTW